MNIDELNKEKKKVKLRKNLFVLSIIILPLINFVVFYVIQNTSAFLMAFQKKKIDILTNEPTPFWSFDNYVMIWEEFTQSNRSSELYIALTNTFKFFALGIIMLPISFMTSYFMYKKILFYKFFQIVFFIPSILSSVVWATIFKIVVEPSGPIAKLIQLLNHSEFPIILLGSYKYSLGTVMAYSVWMGIAGNFILFGGALSRIPVEVIEAGQLDGINWFTEMVKVIIPLIFPTLSTLILLQLTGLFMSSGSILLLTGGSYNTTTIAFHIFSNVYKVPITSNKYNYAASVGLIFTVFTLPLVFVSRWLLNKVEDVQY